MKRILLLLLLMVAAPFFIIAQTNLLLNGGFEEVNTCTEYKSECGVEGWFYLKDVKVQMLLNETNTGLTGANSYGLFSNWNGFTGFTPLIGALLPCGLQKGKSYTFRGLLQAKLHPRLLLFPGFCAGDHFYVPGRSFSKNLRPQVITSLTPVGNTAFYSFDFHFTADGQERYLTFGSFTKEDTSGAKKKLYGTQTISLVLDNFQLLPDDPDEKVCAAYEINKAAIYDYNYRHREMDYALFGKGELAIDVQTDPLRYITRLDAPPLLLPQPDTLKLGDVFFDYNKAALSANAQQQLAAYFLQGSTTAPVDSIRIEGHTDSVGSEQQNLLLSRRRCEAVQQWLLNNRVAVNSQVQIYPFGKSRPVASNKTASGRALNRRVEIIIFRKSSR